MAVSIMKFQSLDAFRGLAAIMVVLFHSSFYAEESYNLIVGNAYLFVDFFFILSGFVMAHVYQNKIGQSLSFKKFVLLRFGRLYPLHLFILLLWIPYVLVKVYVYNHGMGGSDPLRLHNFSTLASNLFLTQSFGLHNTLSWNAPSWSISAEFYTYLVFFMMVLVVSKMQSIMFSLFISVISYAFLFLNYGRFDNTYDLGLIRCIGGFFLGLIVYSMYKGVFSKDFKLKLVERAWLASLVEGGGGILMLWFISESTDSVIYNILSIVSFMLVIWIFSMQNHGVVSRILETRPFQIIGELSYSIYMVHALVFAVIDNFVEYIVGFKPVSFSNIDKAFVFLEGDLINIFLVCLIIMISYATYTFVEVPWRSKFRVIASKY